MQHHKNIKKIINTTQNKRLNLTFHRADCWSKRSDGSPFFLPHKIRSNVGESWGICSPCQNQKPIIITWAQNQTLINLSVVLFCQKNPALKFSHNNNKANFLVHPAETFVHFRYLFLEEFIGLTQFIYLSKTKWSVLFREEEYYHHV